MNCALKHLVDPDKVLETHKVVSWSHYLVDDAKDPTDDDEYLGDDVESLVDDGESLDGLKKH